MKMETLSTDEIFAAMKAAVEATPSLKSKFNASVEFHLEEDEDVGTTNGVGGGGSSSTTARTSKSITLDITKTTKSQPDLVVRTSREILVQILNKKLTPQQAFLQGKLKIQGNMGLAMKLTLVVNATRKQLMKEDGLRSKL
jgi:putative sterol carrier protein